MRHPRRLQNEVRPASSPETRTPEVLDALAGIAARINHCRRGGGCDPRACGVHAIGKPTHQYGPRSDILVVGEAPGPRGWWQSGCAFYSVTPAGQCSLSPTGANLNGCLNALGTRIEAVGFVEAVRCCPEGGESWSPSEATRQRCLPFLREHVQVTAPRLILPLGLTATASCLDLAGFARLGTLKDVVGRPLRWTAPWGECWILPLYHPSPANNGRWPANKRYLLRFAEKRGGGLDAVPSLSGKRRGAAGQ